MCERRNYQLRAIEPTYGDPSRLTGQKRRADSRVVIGASPPDTKDEYYDSPSPRVDFKDLKAGYEHEKHRNDLVAAFERYGLGLPANARLSYQFAAPSAPRWVLDALPEHAARIRLQRPDAFAKGVVVNGQTIVAPLPSAQPRNLAKRQKSGHAAGAPQPVAEQIGRIEGDREALVDSEAGDEREAMVDSEETQVMTHPEFAPASSALADAPEDRRTERRAGEILQAVCGFEADEQLEAQVNFTTWQERRDAGGSLDDWKDEIVDAFREHLGEGDADRLATLLEAL